MTLNQALVLHVKLTYLHMLNSAEEGCAVGPGLVSGALASLQEALRWAGEHGVKEAADIERGVSKALPGGGFFHEHTAERIDSMVKEPIEAMCMNHGVRAVINDIPSRAEGADEPEVFITIANS